MHHLDNAATTFPKPREVIDAVASALSAPSGSPHRGTGSAARDATAALEDGRREIAFFFGASDPRRCVLTLNATDSLSLAIRSLVPPGGRVVTSDVEHAAVARPLRRLETERSVDVVRVPSGRDGRVSATAVRDAARGADAVVMTCASNVTGVVQPFREIAALLADSACPLLLDAAQAAGSVEIAFDQLGPRVAVAFTGHKALLGPMGVGGLLVGDALDLQPWREGGTGDSHLPLQPSEMPRRLEAGTPPLPAIAGLAAGVRWWEAAGVAAVREREAGLMAVLLGGLRSIAGVRLHGVTDAPRVPLVAFTVDGLHPDECAMLLDAEFAIAVRSGLHCAPDAHAVLGTLPAGTLRASVGPTTPSESVDALLEALAEIASGSRA